LESVALFSLKQEAPASIGGSTFTAYTVPIRLDSPLFKWLAASGS
jgi:hypothetical protein